MDVPGTFNVPGTCPATCSPELIVEQIRLDFRRKFGPVCQVLLNKFAIFGGGAEIDKNGKSHILMDKSPN